MELPRRSGRGFSLVELLVVLAIMAVLATVAFPLMELSSQRQKEEELRIALRQIRGALDAYKRAVDEGRVANPPGASGYPPNLAVLVEGVPDARAGNGQKLYFLRRLPVDPMSLTSRSGGGAAGTHGVGPNRDGAAHGGWGLRSYASEPNDPRPGLDVFDVYSRSAGVGLNGVPYREW